MVFNPISICNIQSITAMGRSDLLLKQEILKKIYAIAAAVFAVLYFDSPIAIVMSSVVTAWLDWLVNAFTTKKLIGYSFIEQFMDMFPSMLISLAMYIVVWIVGFWCQSVELMTIFVLVIQVVVGILTYLLLSVLFRPQPFNLLLESINNMKTKNV